MAEIVLQLNQRDVVQMLHFDPMPDPAMLALADQAIERSIRRRLAGRYVQRLASAMARRTRQVVTTPTLSYHFGKRVVYRTTVSACYPLLCRKPGTRELMQIQVDS